MPSPENIPPSSPSPTKTQLIEALAVIDRQLERAADIENPVERFFNQERLLERQDELQAEIDELASPPELP
jgi:hypothetical protein